MPPTGVGDTLEPLPKLTPPHTAKFVADTFVPPVMLSAAAAPDSTTTPQSIFTSAPPEEENAAFALGSSTWTHDVPGPCRATARACTFTGPDPTTPTNRVLTGCAMSTSTPVPSVVE